MNIRQPAGPWLRTVLAAGLGIVAAPASAYDSVYTDLDYDRCAVVDTDIISAVLRCPGYDGIPVRVVDSDLRMTVSYGNAAESERAASQGFAPFNHLGPRIEWLLDDSGAVAGTVLRWYIAQPDETAADNQVLVVTRVEPGATCHVAYIDARANADANILARQAADELIVDFDCADAPVRYGQFEAEF